MSLFFTMQGKIKIEDAANPLLYTISDGIFTIKSGFVTGQIAAGETPETYMLFQWDGRDQNRRGMSSGVYVYRVEVESGGESFSETGKMFLVK